VTRTLYFYPTNGLMADRTAVVLRLGGLHRSLLKLRPGSRQWNELRARIAAQHAVLTADVARIRSDLRRRLDNDYRRQSTLRRDK
jgi:hypothetical protein